jgi:hypothetical protein
LKVIIHAGINRTGTTSLQGFLAGNRGALARHGTWYPGEAHNQQPLCWAIKRGDAGAEDIRHLAAERTGVRTLLLSAENFCTHAKLPWLRDLATTHETRVVFYLRRQDHWLMSWYNQHIKWPFNRRISRMDKHQFLACLPEFEWIDFERLLDRWAGILGENAVNVAVLEKGQVHDVVEHFLTILGVPADGLDFETRRRNDSMPVYNLEIARLLGLFDLKPEQRTRVIRALRTGLAHLAPEARTVFSPDERLRVLDQFEQSNQAVARRFLKRERLFLEPRPSPDDPWYQHPPLSNEELTRDWIAPVIHQLVGATHPNK